MRLDRNDQVQVARRTAGQARLTFARHPHAQTLGCACRDLDLDTLCFASLGVEQAVGALCAVEGFFDRDFDGLLDVVALARRGSNTRASTASLAEELLEQTAQVFGLEIESAGCAAVWGTRGVRVRSTAGPAAEVDARGLGLLDLFPIVAPAVVLLTLF